jgi:hypothetical protein
MVPIVLLNNVLPGTKIGQVELKLQVSIAKHPVTTFSQFTRMLNLKGKFPVLPGGQL